MPPFFNSSNTRFDYSSLKRDTWSLRAEGIREQRFPETNELLQRATRMDFANYLPEDILVKVDRSSMLNSLEVRSPLLDYRIIEFAFGRVPSRLKASSGQRKIFYLKILQISYYHQSLIWSLSRDFQSLLQNGLRTAHFEIYSMVYFLIQIALLIAIL